MGNQDLEISNYCLCFIDLLGQSEELAGEGLLPIVESEEEKEQFLQKVKDSVGSIGVLQQRAKTLRSSSNVTSAYVDELSDEEVELHKEMGKVKPKQQRWSDGLVYFSSLEQQSNKCPMNAVYEIFVTAGLLCFMGLAGGKPLRGAIETAWGVELNENEIYGAVVARAYDLESKVAQYPRIVIGNVMYDYLKSFTDEEPNVDDKLSLFNRNMASLCISMTAVDNDGYRVLNYLGQHFTESAVGPMSKELYFKAYEFICEQYESHKKNRNTKLSMRYTWLRGYFHQYAETHA